MDILSLGISFILGVIASLVATYLTKRVQTMRTRADFRSIEEYWIEYIPDHPDQRRFSIGRFYYSAQKKSFSYDGVNYTDTGAPFYEWKSVLLYPDLAMHRISYFYQITSGNTRHEYTEGFGVLHFDETTAGLCIKGGYFVDCKQATHVHNHTMVPLTRVIDSMNITQGNERIATFHQRIIRLLLNDDIDISKLY